MPASECAFFKNVLSFRIRRLSSTNTVQKEDRRKNPQRKMELYTCALNSAAFQITDSGQLSTPPQHQASSILGKWWSSNWNGYIPSEEYCIIKKPTTYLWRLLQVKQGNCRSPWKTGSWRSWSLFSGCFNFSIFST